VKSESASKKRFQLVDISNYQCAKPLGHCRWLSFFGSRKTGRIALFAIAAIRGLDLSPKKATGR
jgi:hypothetical protein